jgi:hypothetical protein
MGDNQSCLCGINIEFGPVPVKVASKVFQTTVEHKSAITLTYEFVLFVRLYGLKDF